MTLLKKHRLQKIVALLFGTINWLIRSLLVAGSLWVYYSKFYINHKVSLKPPVHGKRLDLESAAGGRTAYYYAPGKGRPLVLVHSINAAASAFEMGPLFQKYAGKRPVYALDLPGFGSSERAERVYSAQLYADVIGEFLEKVVKKPADVAALSLGSEFCARAALAKPEQFHSLALISPSGMGQPVSRSQRTGRAGANIYSILAAPLWSRALFDLIATRVSIRYFLQQSFVGPVPEDLIQYAYAAAHQPGAQAAPLYFLSGALFTRNALEELYGKVTVPGLVIYDQDAFTGFAGLDQLLESSNWQAARITPSRGLPQFEKLEETAQVLEEFWGCLKSARQPQVK